MYLYLLREPSYAGGTLGSLYVDGRRVCDTLEDVIREVPGRPVAEWKIPGRTAIPAGRYRVRWTWSPKFQRLAPEVLEVPGFEGIRLHGGVSADQTEGCILVGFARAGSAPEPIDRLRNVLPAREFVDQLIARADGARELIYLRIDNPRLED